MKKTVICLVICLTVVLGESIPRYPSPEIRSKEYHPLSEPETVVHGSGSHGTVLDYPINRNDCHFTLIDSSMNGYGMAVPMTRPMSVYENRLLMGYRQWAGEGETSGQIGAAFSDDDGYNWTTYQNLNPGMSIGHYPSSLGMLDYPYVFWNVYSGTGAGYGGMPFYTWDEGGWGGGQFTTVSPIDSAWTDNMDMWVGSPDYSYDESTGDHWFNVVFGDWTREDKFLFHSENYNDGEITFGSEILVVDVNNDMVGGDDVGSYTSSPVLDVNEEGIGYVSVSTFFDGADFDTSPYCNTHTIAFKRTDDYGATWYGGQEGSNYFFIDDNVFEHMLSTGAYSDHYGPDTDECADITITWNELFLGYNFDMRVDSQGNPHFITSVLPASDDGIWTSLTESIGWWHFTIDKDHLLNPGPVNSATGWNYSFVISTSESFRDWGEYFCEYGYYYFFPSLAISEESDDVIYVVTSLIEPGQFMVTDDNGTPDDGCDDWGYFLEWSFDNYVIKSEDGGQTWWHPYHFATPDPNLEEVNRPDEHCAHASPDGATDERVYFCYQMPDYLYESTTGDECSPADYKNWIFSGYLDLTSPPPPPGGCATTVNNESSWKLVGLPESAEDTAVTTLFPNAVDGTCFSFNDGYHLEDTLSAGIGYWLRFNEPGENRIIGDCIEDIEITLNEGWSLMAVGSYEVDVTAICDPDSIIVPGTFYTFDDGYIVDPISRLHPGLGYWVRTYSAGMISVCSLDTLSRSFRTDVLADANTITLGKTTLTFGIQIKDENKLSYSLPPKPPTGAFDARFTGDWKHSENGGIIEIMSPNNETNLQYEIKDGQEWALISESGDEYILQGEGNLILTGGNSQYQLIKGGINSLPTKFALHNNYPNPFNPTTTITYDIPNESHITLTIYDLMGRSVKELMSKRVSPGNHSIVWNGTDSNNNSVASGMYLYQLKSGDFVETKKLLILK